MTDQFTRVTREGWSKRLSRALTGIGGGFLLVVGSIAGLAWNENRAVQTTRALNEGMGAVVNLDANGNGTGDTRGRLVHVSGQLTGDVPRDGTLGGPDVPADATRLKRVVEMYQWKESKKEEKQNRLGGGSETVTTYRYSRAWSDRAIDSGGFGEPSGHQNPPMPVEGEEFTVPRTLTAGQNNWTIPAEYVGQIGEERALPVTTEAAGAIAGAVGTTRPYRLAQGAVFFGRDPGQPEIGDFRISYRVATADRASVVAADERPAFAPWRTSNGRSIFIATAGNVQAETMFESEHKTNAIVTWIARFVGFAAMLAGFKAIFAIIGVIGDFVPFIGSIARFATGLVALALTCVLAPLTIGLAWLAVRPLLGASIIAVGIALAVGIWMYLKKRKEAQQQEPVAQPAT